MNLAGILHAQMVWYDDKRGIVTLYVHHPEPFPTINGKQIPLYMSNLAYEMVLEDSHLFELVLENHRIAPDVIITSYCIGKLVEDEKQKEFNKRRYQMKYQMKCQMK